METTKICNGAGFIFNKAVDEKFDTLLSHEMVRNPDSTSDQRTCEIYQAIAEKALSLGHIEVAQLSLALWSHAAGPFYASSIDIPQHRHIRESLDLNKISVSDLEKRVRLILKDNQFVAAVPIKANTRSYVCLSDGKVFDLSVEDRVNDHSIHQTLLAKIETRIQAKRFEIKKRRAKRENDSRHELSSSPL